MRGYDLIVVGAGAAGLLCAGFAGQKGLRVLLIDKNKRPGRKLLITGKGRCNVTNHCDEEQFLRHVRTNPRFLYSAIRAFPPVRTMAFFEELGVALKTERGDRVFPVSDRAADIVDALERFVGQAGVEQRQLCCDGLRLEEGSLTGIQTSEGALYAPRVVVATGGASYPQTGSTGDGYRFAEQAGHTVRPPCPSLVPLCIEGKECRDMMGLSLRNVTLQLLHKPSGKRLFEELGEMLFTHFGVSGPLVLSACSHMGEDPTAYRLVVDLKPGLNEKQLDARLLRDFEKFANRDFINALGDLLPRKLIPVVARRAEIPFETKVHQITREQRQRLAAVLKGFTLQPVAYRPLAEAIVTAGGVDVREVNPTTMESKRIPGLYFVGEVLDLDGYTGGFNLQIAFATGYAAAQHLK